VVRAALQSAASIAGLLITTEAMVAERPKKENGAPAMPARVWAHRHRNGEGPEFLPAFFSCAAATAYDHALHSKVTNYSQ
jgi:hypothetical protein